MSVTTVLRTSAPPKLITPQGRSIHTQVRHPNILAFKDMLELEEKHETVIYVVTEPVTPLEELLAELDVQGEARCAAHLLQDGVQGAGQRVCTAEESGLLVGPAVL